MKKTLLLLAAAAMTAASASADIITLETKNATDIVGTADGDNIIDMTSCKIGDYSFTFKAGAEATASQTPRWWANDQTIRIYKGSELTITAPADMNGIVFSAKSTSACKNFDKASADQGTVVVESPDVTWSAATPATTMTLILPSDVNANFQIQTIKIYTGDDKPAGSDTPEPSIPEATTVGGLLDIENGSEYSFAGRAVVSYSNGSNVYIYDNTGATLLYLKGLAEQLPAGTVVTAMEGKRSDYNGTVEFIPTLATIKTDGTAEVEAVKCATLAEVEATTVDTYIMLSEVDFTLDAENAKYGLATFTDGTEIAVYNAFTASSYTPVVYPEAGKYNLYGLRSAFNGVTQFNFVKAEEVSGVNGIEVEAGEAEYYNLQGIKVANPEKGLYIKVENGKSVKVIF